jgi:hypothetical protein
VGGKEGERERERKDFKVMLMKILWLILEIV